jgi:oxygen-independent coproporphyrinogen-3 oxidase
MSGIYIHVPYCKSKCDYCDFYSNVNTEGLSNFANFIEKELSLRKDYLPKGQIKTIYFGGGTPSILTIDQINTILNAIKKKISLSTDLEITFEANPDDLNYEYLKSLLTIGINRLSIGIQSFSDADLKKLGRRHNANQALNAVSWAAEAGLGNISIDLIYGLPYSSTAIWEQNLKQAFALPVKHLSCYHLIYEDGTSLQAKVTNGLVKPIDEELSVEQFKLLQQLADQNGFVHYEISNLAKEGFFSKHNTSYWQQVPYLGLGPSAHSYNGTTRVWNPKSTKFWMDAIKMEMIDVEAEILTERDKLNEYLLTSLRTIWGIDIDYVNEQFGSTSAQRIIGLSQKFLDSGIIERKGSRLAIKTSHFLISDAIIEDFMDV